MKICLRNIFCEMGKNIKQTANSGKYDQNCTSLQSQKIDLDAHPSSCDGPVCIELGAAAEDVPHRHDPDVEGREAGHEVQRGLARLGDAHRLVVGPSLVGGVVDGPGVGIPMTRGKIRGPDFHN